MGGFGSGRRAGFANKRRIEDMPALGIREIRRRLIPGQEEFVAPLFVGASTVGSIYGRARIGCFEFLAIQDARIQGLVVCRSTIAWQSTPSLPGRRAWWFLCPDCSRRVGAMYIVDSRLACRVCHRLVYRSQSERLVLRQAQKLRRLTKRLGATPQFPPWPPLRPAGMHYATYFRLLEAWGRSDQFLAHWLCERAVRAGLLSPRTK